MNKKRVLRGLAFAMAVILLLVAVVSLLVPVPPLTGTVPANQLGDSVSRFVEVNGINVHYKQTGTGEPTLILLHGFLASLFSWREVLTPLGDLGTLIAYDRPAFGLTSRPMREAWGDQNPYTAEANVELLVSMMDTLGVERAILVGNSAGGTLAVYTALRHPERVQALILVDAAIYTSGGTPTWVRPILTTPQMRRMGPLLLRNIRSWGEGFGRMAWHDPSRLTADVWEGYLKPQQAENWDRALWEFFLASRPLDLEDQLSQIEVPVLVITGDDDRIVPTEESVRLSRTLPDARLVVIPECGHIPQEECPEPFLEAVRGFVGELGESARR